MAITKIKRDTSNLNAEDIPFTPVGNVAATDTQAAIAELDSDLTSTSVALQGNIDTNTSAITQHETDLASNANGEGASLIGIEDSAGNLVATDVEGAIKELAETPSGITQELQASILTHNMTSDADYTLSASENLNGRVEVTDTGVLLTTTRTITVGGASRMFFFTNSTAQSLIISSGVGATVTVPAGMKYEVFFDSVTGDVTKGLAVEIAEGAAGAPQILLSALEGGGGAWVKVGSTDISGLASLDILNLTQYKKYRIEKFRLCILPA